MIFTFYKAQGLSVGKSLVEEPQVGWIACCVMPLPPGSLFQLRASLCQGRVRLEPPCLVYELC